MRNAESSSRWGMARDAMSAKVLSVPATCEILTGAASNMRWRMAKPRSRRCAASDFAVLVAILVTHATLGVLSLCT